MNWLLDPNFWIFGPVVIWALVFAILFNAFIQRRAANKVSNVLEKIFSELTQENKGLKTATSELKVDTFQLANMIVGLKQQLEKVTKAIESSQKLTRKIFWFYPLGGDNE